MFPRHAGQQQEQWTVDSTRDTTSAVQYLPPRVRDYGHGMDMGWPASCKLICRCRRRCNGREASSPGMWGSTQGLPPARAGIGTAKGTMACRTLSCSTSVDASHCLRPTYPRACAHVSTRHLAVDRLAIGTSYPRHNHHPYQLPRFILWPTTSTTYQVTDLYGSLISVLLFLHLRASLTFCSHL